MSVAAYFPDPLRYERNAAPGDFKALGPSRTEIVGMNNRYRGFINDFMLSPREPLTTGTVRKRREEEEQRMISHREHLRQGAHRTAEGGVLYSSADLPRINPGPRPFQGLIHRGNKTSAQMNKFREQRMEAEMDIQKFKQDKISKLMDREQEKKTDLVMLQNYHPWGKPGGGAPGTESKMRGMEETGDPHTDFVPTQMDEYFSQFGRPGAGAPIRTDSGNIRTNLQGDAIIRFQNPPNAGGPVLSAIEPIRYNEGVNFAQKQGLSKEYDHQIQEKALKESEDRLNNLQKELEMLKYNPYGKPGGGAPNPRSSSDTVLMKKNKSDLDYEFHPWGKGYGNPMTDSEGAVTSLKHRHTHQAGILEINSSKNEENCGTGLVLSNAFGGAGDPVRTNSGTTKTRYPITMKKDNFGNATTKEFSFNPFKTKRDLEAEGERRSATDSRYYPFGKPGAGAPLKDGKGRQVAQRQGNVVFQSDSLDPAMKQAAAHKYLEELKSEMYEQQEKRKAVEIAEKTPMSDFTSMVMQGKVGNPKRDPLTGLIGNQHLGTSDVTKLRKYARTEDTEAYHNDLVRAAEDRQRVKLAEREQGIKEDLIHEQHWSDLWGRPGGGAHNQRGNNNKHRIDNILHNNEGKPDYIKNTSEGIASLSPRQFQKNYIQSTHTNMYEVPNTRHNMQQREFHVAAPYATI